MKKNDWLIVLVVALCVGGFLSFFASSSPDGLEWVAEEQGFLDTARASFDALIPDYVVPGIAGERLATSLAGIVGTLAVFGFLLGLGRLMYQVNDSDVSSGS